MQVLVSQNEIDSNNACVNSYRIVSSDLKNVLDSFLVYESQYSYFSMGDTGYTFPITVMDSVGNVLQLASGLKGVWFSEGSIKHIFGILKYQGVSFIIHGRAPPNSQLLYNTKEEIKIPIKEPEKQFKAVYDEPIEDDRYFPTFWIINYENGVVKIVFKQKMIGERENIYK